MANLIDFFGNTKLSEIAVALVDEYKAERIKKVTAVTINDELKVLRSILSHARELGAFVPPSKFKDISTHGKKRNAKPWTREEVGKLIAATRQHSPEILPLVTFLLHTGCRKGEALALEWANVDLKKGMIHIVPGAEWQPKDGEARQIPIADTLAPYLKPRQGARFVFCSDSGERYAFWPQRSFDRARRAAGLTGGPHTARHTYASHFLAALPDLYLLGKVLGHSTSYVTELYGHLLPEHLARAKNAVSFGQERGKVLPRKTMKHAKNKI